MPIDDKKLYDIRQLSGEFIVIRCLFNNLRKILNFWNLFQFQYIQSMWNTFSVYLTRPAQSATEAISFALHSVSHALKTGRHRDNIFCLTINITYKIGWLTFRQMIRSLNAYNKIYLSNAYNKIYLYRYILLYAFDDLIIWRNVNHPTWSKQDRCQLDLQTVI